MFRKVAVVAATAAVTLGAAACSKPTVQTEAQGSVGTALGGTVNGEALGNAGKKTASQGTGTFTVTFTSLGTPKGDVDVVQGSGQFDNTKKKFKIDMDMSGMAESVGDASGLGGLGALGGDVFSEPVEMVGEGDSVYAKSSFLNVLMGGSPTKPWVKFSAKAETGNAAPNPMNGLVPFGGGASGPASFLDTLQGAADNVEDLGTEQIDGVDTHHYRAQIDPSRAKARGVPSQFGDQNYPEDVWVDGNGVVRRVQYEIDPNTAVDANGGGLGGLGASGLGLGSGDVFGKRMRITLNISDPGKPVDIALPPADQVSEGSGIVARPNDGGSLPPIPGGGRSSGGSTTTDPG